VQFQITAHDICSPTSAKQPFEIIFFMQGQFATVIVVPLVEGKLLIFVIQPSHCHW